MVWVQFLTDAGQYVIRFGDIQPGHSQEYIAPDDALHSRGPLFTNTQKHSGTQEMQQLQTAAEQVGALFYCGLYSVFQGYAQAHYLHILLPH